MWVLVTIETVQTSENNNNNDKIASGLALNVYFLHYLLNANTRVKIECIKGEK